jgi:hypothetical protein
MLELAAVGAQNEVLEIGCGLTAGPRLSSVLLLDGS